ncbi:GNAT family N-acetyltransferase [Defluviimonas sp. WL0002]|uniref:GNAT family N-acetyltransferase n=1 Tax=Albidovulum marisflavi TaxID=2984159 RepID=A0ABT2ZHJ8_9RHOB|nr:GNAT family N-acetyltransferase [Defluviimonas sp. WL0002]MCV2870615.1 GNAT family N-acetyltransferase [Defluviimonas sp. WL0002]
MSEGSEGIGFYSVSLNHQKQDKLQHDQRDKWKDGAPFFYLEWVATHRLFQCKGLGTHMLMDALKKASAVSDIVPIYGVALRSLNDRTTAFYERLGFAPAPEEERNPLMILPIWTIKDLVG